MKRLTDNSDASEARHGTLPKTFSSSEKKTKLLSSRLRKNGTPGYVNKGGGRKRVCGGFWSYYACGQQERP